WTVASAPKSTRRIYATLSRSPQSYRPVASLATRRSAPAASRKSARHPAAEAKTRLGLGLLVRHRRGDEDFVSPDDRRRPGDAGDFHPPLYIFVLAPFGRELGLLRQTVGVGSAELRPILGPGRRREN